MKILGNSLFQTPAFVDNPLSWVQHTPFAFFLIEKLRPEIFVELGTHSGNSYFAFCQAVNELKLKTKTFAVDLWTGDEHAGYYPNEVFERVSDINSKNFSSFSNLMKMSFDEAIPYFSDNSIDLLHIDGLHTYEAVKHDYESWLPKMSNKGVIIFHDTNVRERGFGVWKLFEELKDQFPSIEFTHGHGLGLLCIGKDVDKSLLQFIRDFDEDVFIKTLFENLGERINLLGNEENLKKEISQKQGELSQKSREISQKDEELNQKNVEINQKNEELNQKKIVINQKDEVLSQMNVEMTRKNEELNQKKIVINQKDEVLSQMNVEMTRKNEELNQKNEVISQILSSKSWRFTKPVRFIISFPLRIFSKTKFIITTTATIIKHNGGIWNTTKKTLRILRKEGFRKGNFQYHVKYQSGNAKNHEESNGDKIHIEYSDRHENLADTNKTKSKRDETIFHGSSSILFVGHDARLAGAQVLLLSLIKWFNEHTGIEVKVLLLEKDGDLLDKYRKICPVLVWKDLVNAFPAADERRARLFDIIGKIDLIYGNTALAPSAYDELKFLKAPYITHVHELEKSIKLYVGRSTVDKMHLFTGGYIAGSNPVGSNLVRNHCSDEGKIIVINDFIEKRETNFASSKKDLREKMGLVNDGLIIFACGSGYWRKGVDLFIETALILMQKGHSDFHFYWIGENIWDHDQPSSKLKPWNALEQKIEDNDLRNHITFLGIKENFFDYFLAGDIFYLPSREDPFPLVCLEAAQASLPIICFEDAGGMPDFVENDAGFVVPFEDVHAVADKIIFLDKNRDILRELGVTARKKFHERHSLDIAAPQILNYCRKIANLPPTVSVIVPNYNYEKFLAKRLDSILNQTFQDFEIIILDDASTDGSLEVIEKYLEHQNVSLIKNYSNSGSPFVQWHKGFLQAKGEFLWFAEADDFCEPDFLQKLLQNFNNTSVALAYCDSYIVDESDSVTGNYGSYLDKLDPHHWKSSYQVTGVQEINFGLGAKNSIPNASAVLIRKSCINEEIFQETFHFKFSGDWFFYTQIIKGKSIAFLSEKLNFHRKHDQTVTSKFNSDKINLLFKEAELIHNTIIENYPIRERFLKKWEFYISEQILAFYPTTSTNDFNKYYPYDLVKEKIKNIILKSETSKKLVFLTTNDYSANGGSEQLWRQAAVECRRRGHDVMVVIKKWDPEPFFIKDFYNIGIKIIFKGNDHFDHVKRFNPDLITISIGDQDEGIDWYEFCKINKIPYVIVNQLTKEPEYWPIRRDISEQVKAGYLDAEIVLFTGRNNHGVMARRLNCKIPNAGIFYNPFDVDRNTIIPFPSVANGLKIAIVANLLRIHKGQHLAIEVFNLKKWRDRPVHLNLYGKGNDENALRKQVTDNYMTNVTFHGHTEDKLALWKENHAILLPSFMEGLPLALVGAMISGRLPILTDIGAHTEVVDDNINGFIAKKPSVEALDEALERAYQKSNMWEEIGNKARKKILSVIPEDPIDDFISKIIPFTRNKHDYSIGCNGSTL